MNSLYLFIDSSLSGGVSMKKIRFATSAKTAIILGNGPSLAADRDEILANSENVDFVCVNNFCDDPLYAELCPNHYVLLDSYYFSVDAHPDLVDRARRTFMLINDLTAWALTIYVPHSADLTRLGKQLSNPNIRIVKLACVEQRARRLHSLLGMLFDSGYFGPPQINVLLYAVYIAIWGRYSEIYVYGADLSFHRDVDVNQANNELKISHRHFNEKDTTEVLKKNPHKLENWQMPEFLELSADTFYAHRILNEYAQLKGISIVNKSNHSLIDAYARD